VLVMANVAAAVAFGVAAALSLAGELRVGHLLALAVVAGTADAFIGPASAAAVRLVVPKPQLPVALARMQARDHVAHLVGPPLGGALFAVAHGLPLVVDAASYAVFAAASSGLGSSLRAAGGATAGVLVDARAGFGFMWRHPVIRAILTWGGLFNFATGYVFVALTLRLLRAGVHPASIGAIDAAAAVAGLAGAFVAPYLVQRARTGALTFATAFVVAAVLAPVAFTTNVLVVGALMAAGNFLMPANNASIGGYLSAVTPDAMQARVFAAGGILAMGFATAAPTVAGAVLAPLGGVATLLIGAGLVALSVGPLVANRDVRRLGTPSEWSADLETAPGKPSPSGS
jgi:hypothetical protein